MRGDGGKTDSAGGVGDGARDLGPATDACFKCSTCDTVCPVARVDDGFPGPKFQGPEQWRFKRKRDGGVDSSIEKCSNCMRCDAGCPSGVELGRMHNVARREYVRENGVSLRDRVLANYGSLGRYASRFPRITNYLTSNSVFRWILKAVLGVTSEREFPEFAEETFREWWRKRGGSRVDSGEKRVAYFHGCYTNYNTPWVGKAFVEVFEDLGYEVAVPRQRCSGTPMFSNGVLDDAENAARFNVERLKELVDRGYDVVCTCSSCSHALRRNYPDLYGFEGCKEVSRNTYDAIEYLRFFEDITDSTTGLDGDERYAYHAPCHARNQGLGGVTPELLGELGVEVDDLGDSCSGISGTYGWKEEHYETSMEIGREMFNHMRDLDTRVGLTECPTCSMQMEHGTDYDVRHPIEVIRDGL